MKTHFFVVLGCLTEFTGYFLFVSMFNSFNLKRRIPFTLVSLSLLCGSMLFSANDILIMLTPIIMTIIPILCVSKSKRKKYIATCVLSICISDIIESIVGILISFKLGYGIFLYDSYNSIVYLPKLTTLVIIVVFVFMLNILRQMDYFVNVEFETYQIISLTVGIVCCDILIASNVTLAYNYKDYKGILVSVAVIFLFIIYLFSCFYFLHLQYKNQELKNREDRYNYIIKSQKLYFENVVKKNRETQKYRHDMRAHILAMCAIAEKSKNEEMLEYLEKMEKPISKHGVSYTGDFVLDSIINELKTVMDEKGISFEYNGILHLRENIVIFDICSLLYNSLMNAIEGCERLECENKSIFMEVETNRRDGRIRIHIFNTCIFNEDICDIHSLNSSKSDGDIHGIGMQNMREIAGKYNSYIKFFVESGWFHMKVVI